MSSSPLDKKKSGLEKRLARLFEEYEAVNDQQDRTLDSSARIRLKRKAQSLEKEVQKVARALTKVEYSQKHPNRRYLDLQAHLPKIDFREAVEVARDIIDGFGKKGGACLFLLQNSNPMGGKWCIARIKDLLRNRTGDFKSYLIEFSPIARLDEFGLLDGLANYINVEPNPDDLEQYTQTIVRKICNSLQSGSIVLIEFGRWEYVQPQERVLPWFLQSFWVPLINELPAIAQKHRKVRFIGIISVDSVIPSTSLLSPLCCTPDRFDDEKIIELTLDNWTKDEIQDWLELYAGLSASQIDQLVENVYDASMNGVPALVYNALIETLG